MEMKENHKMRRKSSITAIACMTLVMAVLMTGCAKTNHVSDRSGENADRKVQSVYLASPFFNETEIENVEYVEKILEDNGMTYFSPMRHEAEGEPGTPEWAENIFQMDVEEIQKADAVVVLNYGSYSDSGTAWECGYAVGIGKPVVLVHVNRDGDSNLMMHCGSTTNIYLDELKDFDFETMPFFDYQGKMM